LIKTEKLSFHFFIYGYYGYENYGDNLLLSALIENIINICPEANFVIRNLGPIDIDYSLETRTTLTNLDTILLNTTRNKTLRFIEYISKTYFKIRKCDYFIFGGGTLLHATTSLSSLVILATLVCLARINRINVYGVGIGAMDLDSYLSKLIVSIIILFSKDIGVRDEESLRLLPGSKKIRLTADLVYSWLPLSKEITPIKATQKIIAITLWSTPIKNELPFLKTLASVLSTIKNEKIIVRLLVFQNGGNNSGGLSDLYSLEKLDLLLKEKDIKTEYVWLRSSKNEIINAFKNVNVHIGARYHANVISSILQIPFIGINTEPKIFSLCKIFGMPILQLTDTNEEHLYKKIYNSTHSNSLPFNLDNMFRLSKSNYDLIKKDIEDQINKI
jgi:polysaccharide pyruvyl transferase WcaK-like protein